MMEPAAKWNGLLRSPKNNKMIKNVHFTLKKTENDQFC